MVGILIATSDEKLSKKIQKDRIRNYMLQNGSISALEAMRDLGCMRLAARINEMINDGEKIKKTMETSKNMYGEPVHYARYSLATPVQMKLPI